MSFRSILILGCTLALAGACSSEPEPEPVETEATVGTETAVVAEAEPEWQEPEDVHVEGDHITVDRHINFESDSDVILADSSELLDHIADTIQHHPEIHHLKVIGHTDASGGHDHNQELSEQRAAAVVAALEERGVTIDLRASGVGELEPVCEEDTDECHSQNRRVEFLIVSDEDAASMGEEPAAATETESDSAEG
jgi:OOP family OmpA-OmpF porin